MSNRKFYLRHNYQAEMEGYPELTYPLPPRIRTLGALAYQYRLGASASVAPVLDMDSPLRESLDNRGLDLLEPNVPTKPVIAAWQFTSRPLYGDTMKGFSPWVNAILVDSRQREAHDVGKVVFDALQENKAYLARYDSDAGNNFYLLDFITARAQNIEV